MVYHMRKVIATMMIFLFVICYLLHGVEGLQQGYVMPCVREDIGFDAFMGCKRNELAHLEYSWDRA